MPLTYLQGDPLHTPAHFLAFGHNARGRTETDPLLMRLMQQYPAPFATYQRRCAAGKHRPGTLWLWSDSQPGLIFLTVRETSTGATRLRYVQSVLLTLARDYALYGLHSLALCPLGNPFEQAEIQRLIEVWLSPAALPVWVYTPAGPGAAAEP
ncbi:MAG: hypothetical protein MUE40_08060 [Anaerolineae bacterium]|jgi:hypothetical protein|nr:hypothetical protein [Anaerolineae bacterium]